MKIWKYIRKTHLYIGVSCVPLLIFYVLTGLMQVLFGVKTGNQTLGMMYSLHRFQSPGKIYAESELGGGHPFAQALQVGSCNLEPATCNLQPAIYLREMTTTPSELFVGMTIFVAVGFIVLAVTGVQMAHRYSKNKWPVWICLLLGTLLPIWAVWRLAG